MKFYLKLNGVFSPNKLFVVSYMYAIIIKCTLTPYVVSLEVLRLDIRFWVSLLVKSRKLVLRWQS